MRPMRCSPVIERRAAWKPASIRWRPQPRPLIPLRQASRFRGLPGMLLFGRRRGRRGRLTLSLRGESDRPAPETAQQTVLSGFRMVLGGSIFAMIRRRFWPHQRFAVASRIRLGRGHPRSPSPPPVRAAGRSERMVELTPEQAPGGTRLELELPGWQPRVECGPGLWR